MRITELLEIIIRLKIYIDIPAIKGEIKRLKSELASVEAQMEEYLKTPGS